MRELRWNFFTQFLLRHHFCRYQSSHRVLRPK